LPSAMLLPACADNVRQAKKSNVARMNPFVFGMFMVSLPNWQCSPAANVCQQIFHFSIMRTKLQYPQIMQQRSLSGEADC